MRRLVAVLIVSAFLLSFFSFVLAAPAVAQTTADRCAASKFKSTGKSALKAHLCHAKAAKQGVPVDTACLIKAADKMASSFGKAEAKGGCVAPGNFAAVEAINDQLTADNVSALVHSGDAQSQACASSKRKAAGKNASAFLKCRSKAAKKAELVDPVCLSKGNAKRDAAFSKAEAKGGCATGGDSGAIGTAVDAAVTAVVAEVLAFCGDDIAGPTEACDGSDDSLCSGLCDSGCNCNTVCGNNIIEGLEECDGTDDAVCPGECLSSCICPGTCGNGVAEVGEECDDGGNVGGDGCTDDCRLEDTSALCAGVPSTSGTALDIELVGVFSSPVHVTAPPLDPSRVFIVEQGGVIRIVKDGVELATPYLDIDSIVLTGGERGLLSMAFHPDYESNGRFFVNYTREPDGATVVSRFTVSANPDIADDGSEQVLIVIPQPFSNHNGGQIAFGPDAMLYLGMGDGGGGGDPLEAGQDDTTLLAKMLRLDVDVDVPPYHAVPGDNPNAGAGLPLGLIWAKGVRNPWRFSFDRLTGDMFIGDVGQNVVEEVSYQPGTSSGGENYGWNDMEGSACFDPSSGCLTAGRELPIEEFTHSEGCSITGGHMYRGCALPDLAGTYFYSDFCAGFVRTFEVVAGVAINQADRSAEVGTSGSVSTFGEDARGELYIANLGGQVYRVVPDTP